MLKKAAVASGEAEDQEEAKRQAQLEEERQKSHVLVSQTLSKEIAESAPVSLELDGPQGSRCMGT